MLIAESETGSGKTEAALHWFLTLFATGKIDGLYFALPTRVAARELYVRVRGYIARWFPDPELRPVTVLAVPGYAQVDGIPAERILPEDSTRWQDDSQERLRERVWAAEHPKRFLAATVAVGTVDQALLSVIQTAHAHLRSVCLDRSLLVIDEVHASDAYMSRLLTALLRHHLDTGGRAMLLSATLGSSARSAFLDAAGVKGSLPDERQAQTLPYPALTVASGKMYASAPVAGQSKSVTFSCQAAAFSIQDIVPELIRALHAGARVLAVMNTVSRANALQRTAEAAGIDPACLFTCAGVVCPHHGRFSPADRSLLDQAVSARLGKNSDPGPVLLIGTQTLEQSLDLDADLLITDLCPADVLLQRVGRLHRHVRPSRPVPYDRPRCVVLVPAGGGLEQALDAKGRVIAAYKRLGYGSVYEDLRTLALTWQVLEEQPQVQIPRDNRRLVEAVTHPACLARLDQTSWAKHGQNIEGEVLAKTLAADLATAVYDQPFGSCTFNEAGARVCTRLGVDNLRLPLDRTVTSPFGMEMTEVAIPGHMVPQPLEETVAVEGMEDGALLLRCGGRRYRYSRFGLEASDESIDR